MSTFPFRLALLAILVCALAPAVGAQSITREEAVASALNDVSSGSGAVSIDHPLHAVRFTSGDVVFSPARGPRWSWRLAEVHDGNRKMGFRRDAVPTRTGALAVDYDRGQFVERYIARAAGVEQQFILPRKLSLTGDLEIAGQVSTQADFSVTRAGWVWSDESGVVSLGDVTVFDAAGATIPARMSAAGNTTRIVVDGAALASATYPVTIDPEIGTNDFRISDMGTNGDTAVSANYPSVAYNSVNNEFLVAWISNDGTNDYEIYVQRINATTGAEVGANDVKISDMGTSGSLAFRPAYTAIAYSRTSNEYLVVWRSDDDTGALVDNEFEIFGQRLNAATGAEVGANDFRISDMGPDGDTNFLADNPSIAWNSTNNEYLVVWHGVDSLAAGEYEIWGQRINAATGAAVGTNDFRISDAGAAADISRLALAPRVAYNSVNNEYLVVWYGDDLATDNEVEVFGQRLSASTGTEVGTNDFRITDMGPETDTSYRGQTPDVAHNPLTNEYLVVFGGSDPALGSTEQEIFGQRLSSTGAEIGANDFQISVTGPFGNSSYAAIDPVVSYSASLNEFLVVWFGDKVSDNDTDVFGQRISAAGLAVGEDDFRLSDMGPDGSNAFRGGDPKVAHGAGGLALVVFTGDDNTPPLVDDEVEIFGQLYFVEQPIEMHGDFNGDGRDDILLRDSSGNLGMWLMNGPLISTGALVGSPGAYTVGGIGDFNGDGKDDILLRDAIGNLGMWIMNGFTITSGHLVGSPAGYSVAAVADFDGDAKSDILLRDSGGAVGMWIMNGPAISSGASVGATGGSSVVGARDFDGDGKADILLRDVAGNLGLWKMNGATIAAGFFIGSPGAYDVAGVNDFNGDLKADIVLRDALGNIGMWIMNGSAIVSGHLVGSPAGYEVNSVGDYDGGGKADMLLRLPSTGDVGMWIMNGPVIVSGHFVGSPGTGYEVF